MFHDKACPAPKFKLFDERIAVDDGSLGTGQPPRDIMAA